MSSDYYEDSSEQCEIRFKRNMEREMKRGKKKKNLIGDRLLRSFRRLFDGGIFPNHEVEV